MISFQWMRSYNMIVNSARYVSSVSGQNSHINAEIDGVMMAVPINAENRHYEAILEWVADGNTIAEAD